MDQGPPSPLVHRQHSQPSVVKGSAKHAALDRSIAVNKFIDCQQRAVTWYEFVDSHADWSDGISKELASDPFAPKHGFPVHQVYPNPQWWVDSLQDTWARVLALCANAA